MKKEQFKVGMRVIAIGLCDDTDLRGQHGTIRSIREKGKLRIGVEFDSPFPGGHTLFGELKGGSKRGWWCEPGSLIREGGTRLVIEVAGVETTIKGFIGGRDVDAKAKCANGDTPNAYVGAMTALEKAFGVEKRLVKSGEYVVVTKPQDAHDYTMGDILKMADWLHGKNTQTGKVVCISPTEYVVIHDPAIFQPPKRERKAVCIKAPDDSPFWEGRIYTVDADGIIDAICGKVQTHQQEDARRIAAGKNRFFIIDEDAMEAAK